MEAVRKGERKVSGIRRTRFYTIKRDWYFFTREGASIGPFDCLSEAMEWADDYKTYVQQAPLLEDVLKRPSLSHRLV